MVISNIPVGSVVSDGTHIFTATTGNTSLTVIDDVNSVSWNLSALTITPPQNYSGTINMTVTSTSTESANGSTAVSTATLPVVVLPVNYIPELDVQNGVGENAANTEITGSLVYFGDSGSTLTLSGAPPSGLTSGGVAVTYNVSGNTITGMAGANVVFTLVANPSTGTYTFDLVRPLDPSSITSTPTFTSFAPTIVGTSASAAQYYVNATTGAISATAGTDWSMSISGLDATGAASNVNRNNGTTTQGLGVAGGTNTNINLNEKLVFNFDNEMASGFTDPGSSASITLFRVPTTGTYSYSFLVTYTDGSTSTISGSSATATQVVSIPADATGKEISSIALTNTSSVDLRVSNLSFITESDTTEYSPTILGSSATSAQYYVNATTGAISATPGTNWAMQIIATDASGTGTVQRSTTGLGVSAGATTNIDRNESITFDFDDSAASGIANPGSSMTLTLARQAGAAYEYTWLVMFTDGTTETGTSGVLNTANTQTLTINPSLVAADAGKTIDYVTVTNTSTSSETGSFKITSLIFDTHNDTSLPFAFTGTDVNGDSISGTFNVTLSNSDINGTAGNDVIYGDSHNRVINAGSGDDYVYGGSGNELIFGGANNDHLFGGAGNDTINGGAGNDVIQGGQGNDILTGGGGIDIFVWKSGDDLGGATDTITDFKANPVATATDASVLNLSDLLIGEHLNANSLDNYLNITKTGSDTTIKIDPTGHDPINAATQTIVLQGVDLTANNTITSHDIINTLITNGNLITDH